MGLDARQLLHQIERRERAQTHLAAYSEYMLDVTPAAHHVAICDAIDELINDEYDELIILAPPGSAKSTYTSIGLPSYYMGRFPKAQILTASYSTELAEKWGRRVRNIVGSPQYRNLFGGLELSKDSTAAGRWANDKGGELYAAGVLSGILGFRADLAIIDDPVSGFEQAQSMTQLAKMHGWYETDFITRLKPTAKVVLICQRLARNDLAGYMIDRNLIQATRRQRILKLPMLAGEDDPLGRQPGERLWPEWYTEEMVLDAQRDEFKWKTLYQQEPPADTGAWVDESEIQVVDIVPANLKYYIVSDLALSVNRGDWSVHLVVGMDQDENAYFVDAWRKRVSIEKVADAHLALAQTYHPELALIDDDNAGKVYKQLLGSMAKEQGIPIPYKALSLRGQDKETRAAPMRGLFKRKKVFFKRASWNVWLTKEVMEFPNALGDGVDDGIDAMSLLGRHLYYIARPASDEVKPKAPLKTIEQVTLNELWEHRERMNGTRARL
jgi:predicted phage terminase large subunit-like protein